MASSPTIIAGRYEIGDVLGVGGMGTVYRATDTLTNQTVAVKRLKLDAAISDPQVVERFKREAEALRQLDHPNIVKVLDTHTSDQDHYIIMEYVSGGTLGQLIQRNEELPIERVLDIGLGLADALTRAHHLKIIHRDIKPVNVLLSADGTPRLTDFGVAYLGSQERMTATGMAIGTLDYLSPEAINGEPADTRTDIWAFGVLLYEMLVGERPFKGPTPTQTMVSILRDPSPQVMNVRQDVPAALSHLLENMMAKERDDRISSARLVGAELEALRHGTATPSEIRARTPSSSRIVLNEVTRIVPMTGPIPTLTPAPALPLTAPRRTISLPVLLMLAVAVIVPLLIAIVALAGRDTSVVSATNAAMLPTPRVIEAMPGLPESWVGYETEDFTVGLPATWIRLADMQVIATMSQQVLSTFDTLATQAPQFVSFAQYLISPELLTFVATDPMTLTFFIVAVEPISIGITPDILRSRIDGLLSDNTLDLQIEPVMIAQRDGFFLPVDLEFEDIGRMRALVYVVLDGDNVIYIIFATGASTENFNRSVPTYEQVVSTLVLDQ